MPPTKAGQGWKSRLPTQLPLTPAQQKRQSTACYHLIVVEAQALYLASDDSQGEREKVGEKGDMVVVKW